MSEKAYMGAEPISYIILYQLYTPNMLHYHSCNYRKVLEMESFLNCIHFSMITYKGTKIIFNNYNKYIYLPARTNNAKSPLK